MKRPGHFPTLVLLMTLGISGCDRDEVNMGLAIDAGLDALKAATLSDENVNSIAADAARVSDQKNQLASANSPYTQRLQRLAAQYIATSGTATQQTYDFKVYMNPSVNAFAMADGTIRFYSGLMDIMTDEELLFIMGHEMGHVIHDHSHNQLRLAYASSAVRKGAAALNNEVGELARSQLGGLVEQLLNAQYSQNEEKEADDYGVVFLRNAGMSTVHAATALQNLAALGGNHGFLSSHPDPQKRVERLQAQGVMN